MKILAFLVSGIYLVGFNNNNMEMNTPVPVKTTVAMPLLQPERIRIIDALRGFALCGILIMNLPYFALPYQQVGDPRLMGELAEPANHFWWAVTLFYLEGSMRGLFSLLFGAGTILLLSRLEKRNAGLLPADIYYRRLLWLLVFGLINGFLLNWPGDILYHYAIVGMFIFPFRNASPRLLLGFVAGLTAITMLFSYVQKREMFDMRAKGVTAEKRKEKGEKLTEKDEAALAAWNGFKQKMDTSANRKAAEKSIKEVRKAGYGETFSMFSRFTVKLESVKFYSGMFFDVILFFLLGMLLYHTGIIKGEKTMGFYALLMLAGYGLGLGQGYFQHTKILASGFDPFAYYRMGGTPVSLYQLHRICTTLGHLGLLMVLFKSGFFTWLLMPLARMGQMAFTNYLSQSLICSVLFYGYGFGWYGTLQRYELYYVWAAIIAFQMLFSAVWLNWFRFGPLEWVWRSLTYWKRQPIQKNNLPVDMP